MNGQEKWEAARQEKQARMDDLSKPVWGNIRKRLLNEGADPKKVDGQVRQTLLDHFFKGKK